MQVPLPADPSLFCITDIGSTTTKALLFRRDGQTWRVHRAEAPTTVEHPHEDVIVGVLQAFGALEQSAGMRLLEDGRPVVPYLSTSSAGGGLAMVVTGLVKQVTSASAERVALGAGAIVLDVLAMDDGRTAYEKIEALRQTRPDIVLLAGGFDGDALSGPVFLAELLREAGLAPKHGAGVPIPVIFAGNAEAAGLVQQTMGDHYLFHLVPNIRPSSTRENLEPAREAIHSLFMHHVMAHAPGYPRLLELVSGRVLPTPAAFMKILQHAAGDHGQRMLAIDIGGATTDVFTVSERTAFRTVSANLGMSYSALNVMRSAGVSTLRAFAPGFGTEELVDRIGNKHGNPTGLPRTGRDMEVEWALAAGAIREAVRAHLALRRGDALSRDAEEFSLRTVLSGSRDRKRTRVDEFDLSDYDVLVGSGGILSHSRRDVAAMILVNALRPRAPIRLAVDSAFMFPHLGALVEQAPALALRLFNELALVPLGTTVGRERGGFSVGSGIHVKGTTSRGRTVQETIPWGRLALVGVRDDEQAALTMRAGGAALGQQFTVDRPAVGLIVDARDTDCISPCPPGGPKRSAFILVDEPVPVPERRESLAPVGTLGHGLARERRELAVPGDVLVRQGEEVSPSTLVARSRRVFRRPFFLDVARSLGIPPAQVPGCLVRRMGEDITEQDEIARLQLGPLRTKRYLSPVGGTLERLLPSGTLVVREPPELAGRLGTATVAQDLCLRPGQIAPYVKVRVGQHVERGQTVAAVLRPGTFRQSTAPVRGTVKEINTTYGIIHIEPLQEELEVAAWIGGLVEEVTDRGCVVAAICTEIIGFWGSGGEAAGMLAVNRHRADAVEIRRTATREDLEAAIHAPVRALVAGGAHLQDICDLSPPFPVMVTGGFGNMPMADDLWAVLVANEGRVASISGATSLRVGVRRPRLLIPDSPPL
ncbi:MAG: glutamate mutase L [Candidatus Eisenbacteria bacterium]|nr:glutamate mutase L [Candidatus Eisenbacteria bacterium]